MSVDFVDQQARLELDENRAAFMEVESGLVRPTHHTETAACAQKCIALLGDTPVVPPTPRCSNVETVGRPRQNGVHEKRNASRRSSDAFRCMPVQETVVQNYRATTPSPVPLERRRTQVWECPTDDGDIPTADGANPEKQVSGTFLMLLLSNRAQQFAKQLMGFGCKRNCPKCLNGSSATFHGPLGRRSTSFQWTSRAISQLIEPNRGEFYASSIGHAESLGFRGVRCRSGLWDWEAPR
jgi:hypothetical protein